MCEVEVEVTDEATNDSYVTSEYIDLTGTESQLDFLRRSLNDGELISAETTIAGLEIVEDVPVEGGGETVAQAVLPAEGEELVFLPASRRRYRHRKRALEEEELDEDEIDEPSRRKRRKLASYIGTKEVLVGKFNGFYAVGKGMIDGKNIIIVSIELSKHFARFH